MAAASILGSLAPSSRGALAGARPAWEVALPPWQPALAGDALPSWNDGAAKRAITDFALAATDEASPGFVPVADRIATFDLDGTLWVEMPLYVQSTFTVERVAALASDHPEWQTMPPFSTALSGDNTEIVHLSNAQWQELMGATHAGMSVGEFEALAAAWLAATKHPRFDRPYTGLIYQPMLEVMTYLRGYDFRTYIVSGSGQEFIRAFADPLLGVPPEQVIGTIFETTYELGSDGVPVLLVDEPVLLDDNNAGKPQSINLVVGRRPAAAFGNSGGDQQMLEWTGAGERARLMMLVHHDDGVREYAYGPAGGLPDTGIGVFSDALMTEANQRGWPVISMKNDWRRVFASDE